MNRIVLANADYRAHTTDEGNQLQEGLGAAGWTLCGFGYDDCTDVRAVLDRYQPDIVFVQDPRDWRHDSPGTFNRQVAFQNIGELAKAHGVCVATVVKDAGTRSDYQRQCAEEIGADVIVTYYHERSVEPLSPWLSNYPLVRTYHSIDVEAVAALDLSGNRKRGIVSGAVSGVYPLRLLAFGEAHSLKIDTLPHPGYGNRGCHTSDYLKTLAGYKVHVATSSRYAFALRKIIESVACGCIPVTDLPSYDVLPVIDEYLVRVPQGASLEQLYTAIDFAEAMWTPERARKMSAAAMSYYGWRDIGKRLSDGLTAHAFRN